MSDELDRPSGSLGAARDAVGGVSNIVRREFMVTWDYLTAFPNGTHDECWIWALEQDEHRDLAIEVLSKNRDLIANGKNQEELLAALDHATAQSTEQGVVNE